MINVFLCKIDLKEIQFEHVFRCRFEIPLFYPGFSIWCHLNACFVEFNSNHAKLNREGQLKKRNKLFFSFPKEEVGVFFNYQLLSMPCASGLTILWINNHVNNKINILIRSIHILMFILMSPTAEISIRILMWNLQYM